MAGLLPGSAWLTVSQPGRRGEDVVFLGEAADGRDLEPQPPLQLWSQCFGANEVGSDLPVAISRDFL